MLLEGIVALLLKLSYLVGACPPQQVTQVTRLSRLSRAAGGRSMPEPVPVACARPRPPHPLCSPPVLHRAARREESCYARRAGATLPPPRSYKPTDNPPILPCLRSASFGTATGGARGVTQDSVEMGR